MAKNQRIPRLGRHAPSGQGRVRLNEADHYLGVWPDGEVSPPGAVKVAYDRLVAEWLAGGRGRVTRGMPAPTTTETTPADAGPCEGLTVVEMAVQYMKHCRTYYRHPGGEPTGEAENVAGALRPLVYLFGTTAAASFGALALGRVVDLMVSGYAHPEYGDQVPLTRPGVNARLGRIKNAFGWAVSKELVPSSIREAVRSVKPLAPGRTEAKETPAVKPVPESVVEATLPFLSGRGPPAGRVPLLPGAGQGGEARSQAGGAEEQGAALAARPEQEGGQSRARNPLPNVGLRARRRRRRPRRWCGSVETQQAAPPPRDAGPACVQPRGGGGYPRSSRRDNYPHLRRALGGSVRRGRRASGMTDKS